MSPELKKRIEQIAGDRESGASEILVSAIAILRDALTGREDVGEVVHLLRLAQPSMAPMWSAGEAAMTGNLERFAKRVEHAPRAIRRFAIDLLETGLPPGSPLRIVTLSYSGTVAQVIEGLVRRRPVQVACSEGRPALEGRRLASRLCAAGASVTCFSDAAIGHGLEGADALLVGADAVAPGWFLNKSGTWMLAASAALRGVPVYVLAGREKFIAGGQASHLSIRVGPPAEIWPEPDAGVAVLNPYFERTPLELVSAVVSDAGVLGLHDIAQMCEYER